MSTASDLPAFRSAVLASGLIDSAVLKRVEGEIVARKGEPPAEESRGLATALIDAGELTEYQADQLLAGRTKLTLGPYIITDWIGQGGMGQVFKATHRFMHRECAVKVLPTNKTTEETVRSFMREVRMQAQLDHPNLVRAYDAGEDGNVYYMVTEYVAGMDLRRLVKSGGALPVSQAASIVMQAAIGLQYAHDSGLVHRDVKPGNILVTPEGDAKVSDIGLAGFASDLTMDPRAGKIVGTADFIAPEQIRAPLEVTAAADIYSLGCTLYYAVCGKVPFPGGSVQDKLKRQLSETPWHPRKFAPHLTDEFVDIIADMMDKDPLRRTQTCAEVAARLESWSAESIDLAGGQWDYTPWLAPPPPGVDPSQAEMLGSETGGDSMRSISHSIEPSGESHATASPSLSLQQALHNPPQPGGRSPRSGRMQQKTLVMLTLAIAVPPALLLGFILGYLLKA